MRTWRRMLAGAVATGAVVAGGVVLSDAPVEPPTTSADTSPASPSPTADVAAADAQASESSADEGVSKPARDAFDRTAFSTVEARSPWVVVNKKHPIEPADFRPDITLVRGYQVASVAVPSLRRMLAASDEAGLGLKIASAYRSLVYQQTVYGNVVASLGSERADQLSARPGFSEHQTGLAVDLVTPAAAACDFDACFATTPAGRWLAAHAWEFGFVTRYPVGGLAITGYTPEPWHLRYVGRPLAAEMRRTHTPTLEQFFGIPGGDYR